MTEPKYVFVEWKDAWGDSSDDARHDTVAAKHQPEIMETPGWLLYEDETGVSLFHERSKSDGSYRGRTFIPRVLIVSVTEVRLVKPRRKPATAVPESAHP